MIGPSEIDLGRGVVVSEHRLRQAIDRFHRGDGAWTKRWGPPPGHPRCRVPAHFLAGPSRHSSSASRASASSGGTDAAIAAIASGGAEIIPFPVSRRVALIRKTASFMASSSRAVAESHARVQAEKLEKSLTRKGVSRAIVEREVASYRSALDAALWRAVLTPEPGDAA